MKTDDITLTIVRDTKPAGLFRYFEEHDYMVSNSHIWLRALSHRMEKQDITKLLESINCFTQKSDQELADSVLEVSV